MYLYTYDLCIEYKCAITISNLQFTSLLVGILRYYAFLNVLLLHSTFLLNDYELMLESQ